MLACPTLAHAGDSTWLVCSGRIGKAHIMASVVEHRAADGASRAVSVTLLRGVHAASAESVVTGKVTLAPDFSTLALTGKIDMTFGDDKKAPREAVNVKLACVQLDDLQP
jgi:hypothetical protein